MVNNIKLSDDFVPAPDQVRIHFLDRPVGPMTVIDDVFVVKMLISSKPNFIHHWIFSIPLRPARRSGAGHILNIPVSFSPPRSTTSTPRRGSLQPLTPPAIPAAQVRCRICAPMT